MTRAPLVSILLPSYNYAKYLRACIESICTQTIQDFELLVLDDGSSDESVHVAEELAKDDARIVVWSRENRGVDATLNELYSRARGQYIAQIGSDDLWLPRRLAIGVEAFTRDSDLVASFSSFFTIDGDGAPVDHTSNFSLGIMEGEMLYHRMLVQNCVCACTALVRKEALGDEPYSRKLTLVQDWDLWLRLGAKGKLRLDKEVGALYRWHGNNLTDKLPHRSMVEHRIVYEMVSLPALRKHNPKYLMATLERLSNYTWALGDREATAAYLKEISTYRPLTADERVCQLLGYVSGRAEDEVARALKEIQTCGLKWQPKHQRILKEIVASA